MQRPRGLKEQDVWLSVSQHGMGSGLWRHKVGPQGRGWLAPLGRVEHTDKGEPNSLATLCLHNLKNSHPG
jgi:hypothetical protein